MDEFIRIPETRLPSGLVVECFDVGVFLCSKGPEGHLVVTADHAPWTHISYQQAIDACKDAGYALITESQALAIAYLASRKQQNWTGYRGHKLMLQGIRKGGVTKPQPGMHNPEHLREHRWMRVLNGTLTQPAADICDFNGNAWSWIFDDIQGDHAGLPGTSFTAESDSPSRRTQPHPPMTHGMGCFKPYSTGAFGPRAIIRGGCYISGKEAGAFGLKLCAAEFGYLTVGFRCTRPRP